MARKLSRNEFISLLLKHDWDYIKSNRSSVWNEGQKSKKKIEAAAAQSPEFTQMYYDYQDYKYAGGEKPSWIFVHVPGEAVELAE